MKKEDRLLVIMLSYQPLVTTLYVPFVLYASGVRLWDFLVGYNSNIVDSIATAVIESSTFTLLMILSLFCVFFIAAASVKDGYITAPLAATVLVMGDIPTVINDLIECVAHSYDNPLLYRLLSLLLTLLFEIVLVALLVRYLLRHTNSFKAAPILKSKLRNVAGIAMLIETAASVAAIIMVTLKLPLSNYTSLNAFAVLSGNDRMRDLLWILSLVYLLVLAFCAVMIMRGANDALPIAAAFHIFDALGLLDSVTHKAFWGFKNVAWNVIVICGHLAIDIAIIWAVLKIEQNSKLAEKQA